tara:strand:- start:119 stop:517 length:399 start_codon:yes stop_codon:yes gene_type:complete
METIYFILGALSVVTLVAVLGVFKIKRELEEFSTRKVEALGKDFFDSTDMIERRIDQEIDRVNNIEDKLYEYIDHVKDECESSREDLYKHIDSRIDKLEARFDSRFTDHASFVDGILNSVDKVKKKLKERTV